MVVLVERICFLTSDNEWQRVVQQVTTSDNEWQRMTTSDATSDNEWYSKW